MAHGFLIRVPDLQITPSVIKVLLEIFELIFRNKRYLHHLEPLPKIATFMVLTRM